MKRTDNWMRRAVSLALVLALCISLLGCVSRETAPLSTEQTTASWEQGQPTTEQAAGLPEQSQETTPQQTDADDPERETQPDRQDGQPDPDRTEPTQEAIQQTDPAPTVATEPTQPPKPTVTGQLKVHFIDVGQADAALVQCDGRNMLIDGGNRADSNLLYTYMKKHGVTHLDYVIGTHAHEDHIGGIPGALQYATVGKVYCPVRSYSTKAFSNFVSAVEKRGASITVPSVGTSFSLGGASVKILAVNTTSDTNNSSIVLRITYGNTSFLFTGDAEREVEQALINAGAPLKSTVLKVGHHGSSSSSSYGFLWHVMPAYSVISVGTDNDYGHPTKEVLSRLRDSDTVLYRTDMQGDIIATSNGSSVSFKVSRNANADTFGGIGGNSAQTTQPTQSPETTEPEQTQPSTEQGVQEHFIINKTSGMFHRETCENAQQLPEDNREDFYGYRQQLQEPAYFPCPKCDP